ncbi:uncharacterized protein IWZ02DRAFT_163229 [Phyllosticta citriasiana]|uniref:uncharacterized protein n=1 Tax=Phyllosticta citriasiana TaxID=595635 RepID=UPI0030FDADAA
MLHLAWRATTPTVFLDAAAQAPAGSGQVVAEPSGKPQEDYAYRVHTAHDIQPVASLNGVSAPRQLRTHVRLNRAQTTVGRASDVHFQPTISQSINLRHVCPRPLSRAACELKKSTDQPNTHMVPSPPPTKQPNASAVCLSYLGLASELI